MESNPELRMGFDPCWPEAADAAWQGRSDLERRRELVDDSHFHVMILACKACGQPFLSVFTELTDHAGGDDSQGWVLLPLTAEEERLLSTTDAREIEDRIYSTGESRTSLLKIHARGREANVFWSSGVPMLPYG